MGSVVSTVDVSQGGFLAVAWVGAIVASTLSIARIWIRLTRLRRLFWDDAYHFFALLVLIICAILYIPMAPVLFEVSEVSRALRPVTVPFLIHGVPHYFRYQFVMIVLFWTIIWSIKLSFLIFYRRFFEGLRNHMIAWWCVLAFTLMAYVGCWISFLTACGTPSNYFHSSLGACELHSSISRAAISVKYSTSVDILSDLMIMALPLRILWALRIDMRQKFALAGIFCLGFIVIIFSIVRAITTSMSLTNEWSLKESDPVWLALWSVLESTIAVCVSCLPSFRLLYTDKNKSPSNQSPIDSNNPPTIGSGSSKKSGIRKATSVTVMSSRHSRLGSHDSIEMSQSSTLSPATQTTSSGWTTLSDEKNRARSPTIVEPPAENIYTHEELEEDEPPPRPGTLAQEEEGPYELDARGNRTPRTPRSPSSPAPVYAPPGNSYETTMKRASHGSMV